MLTLHIWTEYRQARADEAKGRTVTGALTAYGFSRKEARAIAADLESTGEARCRIYTIRRA